QSPTLVYGGAEDMLPGTAAAFQEGMKRIVATIPNGKARLQLLPGLGHVPFIEAPERALPPLVAFLREGLTKYKRSCRPRTSNPGAASGGHSGSPVGSHTILLSQLTVSYPGIVQLRRAAPSRG